MTSAAATDLRAWSNLFDLTKREAEDRRGLDRQLNLWSERFDARAVVFGVTDEADDGPIRLAATDPCPLRHPDDADATWRRVELPGLLALHNVDEDDDRGALDALVPVLAAARISQLKRHIERQSFQASFRGVELEALYEVGLAIASTLDLEQLGEEVLVRALLLLDARRGALYLLGEDGCYHLSSQVGGDDRDGTAWGTVDHDTFCATGSGNVPEGLLPGARHLMAAPVELDGDPRGLLVVADKESRRGVGPFPESDRRTLSLFANQAAIALENAKLHRFALEKERLEREMELAAEIQQQILPKTMPEIGGHQVIGWNRPARQVGGDYFGFQELDDGRWSLLVGDVTGKGMPASLLVSTLHSALRVLLDRVEVGPALIERLNRHVCESSSLNKFITLILLVLDPASSRITTINAGHNPGVVIRTDGGVTQIPSDGLPVGLMPHVSYGSGELGLEPGDLLCLYSDGITECEAPDEEQYGLDRFVDLLRAHADHPLDEILAVTDRAMLDWADGQAQGDDQTVVLLRRTKGA